jgi:hypothetical protein
VLNRQGFGWVIAQAEAQIAEGKPSSKQVSEYERVPASADPMFTMWECGVFPNSADADALLHSFARAFRNYKVAF